MLCVNETEIKRIDRPIKFLQFCEGNFLRAFVDKMMDIANEKGAFDGSIVMVKPRENGNVDSLRTTVKSFRSAFCPWPTVKISSNSELSEFKNKRIDFDAGRLLGGEGAELLENELFSYILDIA